MKIFTALILCLLGACGPYETHVKSAADVCRQQNSFRRLGRGLQQFAAGSGMYGGNQNNSTADALEEMRCDALGREEREERRERTREQREEDRQQVQESRAAAEVLAAIRRHPKHPELGATRPEGKLICENQRGVWLSLEDKVGCKVAGTTIFACLVADDADMTLSSCTVYFEGGDLSEWKDHLTIKLGNVESQEVSEKGFRTFRWAGTSLGMYEHGVFLTVSR